MHPLSLRWFSHSGGHGYRNLCLNERLQSGGECEPHRNNKPIINTDVVCHECITLTTTVRTPRTRSALCCLDLAALVLETAALAPRGPLGLSTNLKGTKKKRKAEVLGQRENAAAGPRAGVHVS